MPDATIYYLTVEQAKRRESPLEQLDMIDHFLAVELWPRIQCADEHCLQALDKLDGMRILAGGMNRWDLFDDLKTLLRVGLTIYQMEN